MKKTVPIILNNFQIQAINGSLLGDGCLSNPIKNNSNLSIARSIKDIDYLRYELSIFKNLTTSLFDLDVIQTNYFSKKLHKNSKQCYFRTINNVTFTELENKWYKDRVKIIPLDLQLSAITMAHWIADDGCFQFPKSDNRFILELATDGFTKDEVVFLIHLLENRYKEKFHLKQSKYYSIRAYDNASRAIIKDIDSYFKMYRKRYWDNPKHCFYSNLPEKQIEKSKRLIIKQNLVEEIIATRKEISLKELFETLGYKGKISSKKLNLF